MLILGLSKVFFWGSGKAKVVEVLESINSSVLHLFSSFKIFTFFLWDFIICVILNKLLNCFLSCNFQWLWQIFKEVKAWIQTLYQESLYNVMKFLLIPWICKIKMIPHWNKYFCFQEFFPNIYNIFPIMPLYLKAFRNDWELTFAVVSLIQGKGYCHFKLF